MSSRLLIAIGAITAALAFTVPATAGNPKGFLYHDGAILGTTVVPGHVSAGSGKDPLYRVTNGVGGQLGIAGVAPGDGPYHGGSWKVYTVTFNVTPYLLTSDDAVMAAEMAGDVTVTRVPNADFRCPLTTKNN